MHNKIRIRLTTATRRRPYGSARQKVDSPQEADYKRAGEADAATEQRTESLSEPRRLRVAVKIIQGGELSVNYTMRYCVVRVCNVD